MHAVYMYKTIILYNIIKMHQHFSCNMSLQAFFSLFNIPGLHACDKVTMLVEKTTQFLLEEFP